MHVYSSTENPPYFQVNLLRITLWRIKKFHCQTNYVLTISDHLLPHTTEYAFHSSIDNIWRYEISPSISLLLFSHNSPPFYIFEFFQISNGLRFKRWPFSRSGDNIHNTNMIESKDHFKLQILQICTWHESHPAVHHHLSILITKDLCSTPTPLKLLKAENILYLVLLCLLLFCSKFENLIDLKHLS